MGSWLLHTHTHVWTRGRQCLAAATFIAAVCSILQGKRGGWLSNHLGAPHSLNAGTRYGCVLRRMKTNEDGPMRANDVIVVINDDGRRERIDGILQTWGQDIDTVITACGQSKAHPNTTRMPEVPCADSAPMPLWAYSLMFVAERFNRKDWFLMCEDDTYVNVRMLSKFLSNLQLSPSDPYYFGAIAGGRHAGRLHVQSGPCIVMSAAALTQLRSLLPRCVHAQAVLPPPGQALAGCFESVSVQPGLERYSNDNLRRLFRQVTPVFDSHNSTLPAILDPNWTTSLTLHSIKDADQMLRVHAQLRHQATPLSREHAPHDCVHNPWMYKALTSCQGMGFSPYWTDDLNVTYQPYKLFDRCSKTIRECPLPVVADYPKSPALFDKVYIMTLHGNDNTSTAHRLLSRLREHFPRVQLFPGVDGRKRNLQSQFLSPGELGYRASYISIFKDALQHKYKTVAIFDDDALLSLNFDSLLAGLLSDQRCSCHLSPASGCTPGILLLGATIYNQKIFVAMDIEKMSHDHCVNFVPNTLGSFAVAFNVNLFPHLLRWFARQQRFPADWLYSFAAQEGFVVRVAYPFLAIADLTKHSSVKTRPHELTAGGMLQRLRLHRWNASAFEAT